MPWRTRARVHVRQVHRALVITASGEFDTDEQDLLPAAWAEADERTLPLTVLDLSGVTFGDSSFLNALLHARALHHTAGRRLALVGPLHPSILLLLTVTHVLEHFDITGSVTQALSDQPPPDDTATG
ncbi:STAS domain-containing protein [Streptomyces microflavus]|uniref:STAS domain-containing protein n=1 Tax=Streptomyces microflavus TaxID=1919 RepID=UPI00331BA0CA